MTRLIYVDSGVLLAAVRGVDEIAQEAFAVLHDPDVQFVERASSPLLRVRMLSVRTIHSADAKD
jgi:hypothetical protein